MKSLYESNIPDVGIIRSDLKAFLGAPVDNSGLMIMRCEEGCAVLSLDFKRYSFKKSDVAIVPKEMSLIPLKTSSLFQAEIICVATEHCEETENAITDFSFWEFMTKNPILHPDDKQHQMLCHWFAQTNWIMSDSTFQFRNEAISCSIYTLLMLIHRETSTLIQEHDNKMKRGRMMEIFTDFTNSVSRYHKTHREVAFYANLLSITPDYLNKVCRTQWNMSAKEHIDMQVIMTIKSYLTCTALSVKCIAAQLNFEDPSYMCRFFKKQTGMTPIAYRDNVK